MPKKAFTVTVVRSFTETVIVYAEDSKSAMERAEELFFEGEATFSFTGYPDIFASEAYESHPSDLGIFDTFDKPVEN